MTGVRLELANPNSFDSPKDYVEKHLAPVVTELHRVVNELMTPGSSSAEDWITDAVPATRESRWQRFDKPLIQVSRHVTFDGSEYFTLPKELLKTKRPKVQLSATVYSTEDGCLSRYRLVDEFDDPIEGSEFETCSQKPSTITRILPFGEARGLVHPSRITYYLQGRSREPHSLPVCRRFSMSFVYI